MNNSYNLPLLNNWPQYLRFGDEKSMQRCHFMIQICLKLKLDHCWFARTKTLGWTPDSPKFDLYIYQKSVIKYYEHLKFYLCNSFQLTFAESEIVLFVWLWTAWLMVTNYIGIRLSKNWWAALIKLPQFPILNFYNKSSKESLLLLCVRHKIFATNWSEYWTSILDFDVCKQYLKSCLLIFGNSYSKMK